MFRTRFMATAVTAAAILCISATASLCADTISEEQLRTHIRILASDALGGRAPGSEGERLTLDYLQEQFQAYGYEPGNPDGTFLQEVPLLGYNVTNSPALHVAGADSATLDLSYGNEFVGWTLRQFETTTVDAAELVFVGYGVVAPEYEWNDYSNINVTGKIAVILVGDPPLDDPSMFGGDAMTYYGRWTYKYEMAAAMGAAGAILVHDTDAAGYGWGVIENSWSGEQFNVVLEDRGASRCAFESWITSESAERLFELAGRSFKESADAAVTRDFEAFSLGLTGTARIETSLRTLTSNNFVARLPGADPLYRDEHIVYCAHWDHLGIGKEIDGDNIYNGALDNASGVAGMLEVARAFLGIRHELKRSIVFMIPTAEESGLLGTAYYAEHPLFPLEKTVAMINVDGLNVWGRTRDMVVVGYGQSELDTILQDVLSSMGRHIAPDREPQKGFYYRSDHFEFARKGVPALYSDSGVDIIGKPAGWGMQRRLEYNRDHYHTPSDEYHDSWNLAGAADDLHALFLVGLKLATTDIWPQWSETSEFKHIREEAMSGTR